MSRARLLELVWGYRLSQALHAATKLGIPDLLAAGVARVDAIAAAARCHEPSLYRLLRALAGVGIFEEIAPRQFALAPVAEALRGDVANSIRPAVLMLLDEWNWTPWARLTETVRTGATAFNEVHGAGVFTYLSSHPEQAASFNAAMESLSGTQARAVAEACELSSVREIVDVGGGRGALLGALLDHHPQLRGILFDMPHVLREAAAALEGKGIAARCRLVPGSFFDAVPSGADACVLRDILHDWDDERAAMILTNCHAALPPRGRLILVERVVGRDLHEALPVLLADLEMMVNIGGRERTEEELRALLDRTGFRWERSAALGEGLQHSVIEALAL